MLDRGFSIEESAAIRNLEAPTIVRHATLMVRKGHRLAVERLIPAATLELWESHRRLGGTAPPEDSDDPLGLWALFAACRGAGS